MEIPTFTLGDEVTQEQRAFGYEQVHPTPEPPFRRGALEIATRACPAAFACGGEPGGEIDVRARLGELLGQLGELTRLRHNLLTVPSRRRHHSSPLWPLGA